MNTSSFYVLNMFFNSSNFSYFQNAFQPSQPKLIIVDDTMILQEFLGHIACHYRTLHTTKLSQSVSPLSINDKQFECTILHLSIIMMLVGLIVFSILMNIFFMVYKTYFKDDSKNSTIKQLENKNNDINFNRNHSNIKDREDTYLTNINYTSISPNIVQDSHQPLYIDIDEIKTTSH